MVLTVRPCSADNIRLAAAEVAAGQLVAFPTETVYGLGADARNGVAVAKIFAAKGRPQFNPVIVHASCTEDLEDDVMFDERARMIAAAFWPGPLTLILKRKPSSTLSDLVSAGLPTVAVRVPDHPAARDLIRLSGTLIAAPSANKSGSISPTAPHHVIESLGDHVHSILAAGACRVGLESTVLDLSGEQAVILRAGAVTAEDIAMATGIAVSYELHPVNDTPKSPGQLLRHYAPSIPVRLKAVDVAPNEALLAFGSLKFMGVRGGGFAKDLPAERMMNLSAEGDLFIAAANLFSYLRILEKSGAAGIAVMDIPDTGIGIAINERLSRAAKSAV